MRRLSESEWQTLQAAVRRAAKFTPGFQVTDQHCAEIAERMGCIPPFYPPTPEEIEAALKAHLRDLRRAQSTYCFRPRKGAGR